MVKIKNAVQPDAWYKVLPRPEYKNYIHVMTHEGWYEVYDLETDTYAIYEPGHFQEVISYLILGSEKALLLDTGMGICRIRPV
ncbi:MAG: MBL fold metallo-hydrolase, partial [Clostridia bacterium]|nr:MBL fold metallo-hydrolase [Clostridia bacterium]MBN2884135.1 MBL fold metallo-hydrolase [Clostridia bacterium]